MPTEVDPWDVCVCGHAAEDHENGEGQCQERVSSGFFCSCPGFTLQED